MLLSALLLCVVGAQLNCACEVALQDAQTKFNVTSAILANATQACASSGDACTALLSQVQRGLNVTQTTLLAITACTNDEECKDVPTKAAKSIPKMGGEECSTPNPVCAAELKQLTLDFMLFANKLSDDMMLCCF